MDWKSIEAKIAQDDQNKWDRKVSGQELRVSSSGAIEMSNGDSAGKTYSLSEVATSQMCQKLEIPVKYYRRLPDEMKATVANFDIGRLDGNFVFSARQGRLDTRVSFGGICRLQ
jgi:hypothetical protein